MCYFAKSWLAATTGLVERFEGLLQIPAYRLVEDVAIEKILAGAGRDPGRAGQRARDS